VRKMPAQQPPDFAALDSGPVVAQPLASRIAARFDKTAYRDDSGWQKPVPVSSFRVYFAIKM